MSTDERRHDIDWLRVIAFSLLIFYHTGMFFVPWDFHFKNSQTSDLFELWMAPLSQFRLPLLFMISGMGSYFVLKHRKSGAFFRERSVRLMLPLLFGMFVIVPPQIFYEHLNKGVQYSSYFEFYKKVFEFKPYPEGGCLSWHHLWYILYIFFYSVICFPLIKYLTSEKSQDFKTKLVSFFSKPGRIYLVSLPNISSPVIFGEFAAINSLLRNGKAISYNPFVMGGLVQLNLLTNIFRLRNIHNFNSRNVEYIPRF